jgi:branched-chain amino acid transport system ATP-binding protein
VVEQNARAALELADRAYVMESGQVVMEGTAAELVEDERMQTAYLGKREGKEASSSRSDDKADRL